jgi:hypothetical protein
LEENKNPEVINVRDIVAGSNRACLVLYKIINLMILFFEKLLYAMNFAD